jgi:putative transposase
VRRHEMTEQQWETIRPLVHRRIGRPSDRGDRNFVNAVLWIAKTGAPWRDLPKRFGKWKTIYNRFHRWSQQDRWGDLLKKLGCDEEEVAIIDATVVRAHQDSSGGRGGPKKTQ